MPDFDWILAFLGTTGTGALAVVGRKVYTTFKKVASFFVAEYKQITEDRKLLREMAVQFKPNGGSSMRDSLDRVEYSQIILEHKVALIFQDSPEAHFESDANGACVGVNDAYLQLLGASFQEVQGNDWSMFIHPDDRQEVYKQWMTAVAQKRQFHMSYRLYNLQNKTSVNVTCHALPIRDMTGRVLGYIGTLVKESKSNDLRPKEAVWAAGLRSKFRADPTKYHTAQLGTPAHGGTDVAVHKPDVELDDSGS